MKYMIFTILLLISIGCMVVGKKLIDGERLYNDTANIYSSLGVEFDRLFISAHELSFDSLYDKSPAMQARLKTTEEQLDTVSKKRKAYYSELRKLEPLHDKYQQIISTLVITLLLSIAAFMIFGFFKSWQRTKKHYANLVKEGKMTQAEYDELLKSCYNSASFSDDNTNGGASSHRTLGCGRGWSSDDDFVRRREDNYANSSSSRWDY